MNRRSLLSTVFLAMSLSLLIGCAILDPVHISDPVPDPIPAGTVVEFDVRELSYGRFEFRDWDQAGPTVVLPRPVSLREMRRWIISVAWHYFENDWELARARMEFPDGSTGMVTMTVQEADSMLVEVEPLYP